ncbi:MAG: 6-phosphogluconate dehydrogenase, partial [Betaproteobacteria bacterium]|nr:6-phosphogluconate dehydrogenase [Betaproteobacteria bacterium]
MTPRLFEGAADVYTMVAGTALGKQTPESRDKSVDGREVIRRLADER